MDVIGDAGEARRLNQDETLLKLGIELPELKQLVASGELRARLVGDSMKFEAGHVDAFLAMRANRKHTGTAMVDEKRPHGSTPGETMVLAIKANPRAAAIVTACVLAVAALVVLATTSVLKRDTGHYQSFATDTGSIWLLDTRTGDLFMRRGGEWEHKVSGPTQQ